MVAPRATTQGPSAGTSVSLQELRKVFLRNDLRMHFGRVVVARLPGPGEL